MPKSVSHLRAIGYALAGFTLWVLSDVCMKLAAREGKLPPQEVVAFLGLTGALLILLRAWPRGEIRALWPKHPRSQLGRALLALATVFLNAIALKHLPLTVFYVTAFVAPMQIAVLAALLLGERLSGMKILAVIGGFAGVVIAIDPLQHISEGDWIGYAATLGGTVCFALNMVWLRKMTQSESTTSLAFFTGLVQAIFGFAAMFWQAEPLSGKLLFILLLMGTFNVAGNLVSYMAYKYTTAANVAQFHYTQIITGAAFGYLIWRDVPTVHLIAGAAIIIASGLYIVSHARKTDKLPQMPV